MADYKEQHYLAKFYLKHFLDPMKDGHLWVYRDGERFWKSRGFNTVAWQPYLYSRQTQTGKRDHSLETEFLGQAETRIAPVLKKLADGNSMLANEERVTIATMVALWIRRVPAYFEWAETEGAGTARSLAESFHNLFQQQPDALEEFKDFYRNLTGRKSLDDLTVEETDTKRGQYPPPRDVVISTAFSQVNALSEIIKEMAWAVYRSDGSDYFITSDSPVFLLDTADGTAAYAGGLAEPHIELSCPLTRNLALVATWDGKQTKEFPAPRSLVENINKRTVHYASYIIVSPATDFPGVESVVKRFEENAQRRSNSLSS